MRFCAIRKEVKTMQTLSKSKLTLWVRNDTKKFGKQWAKQYNTSLSQIFSDYLLRLRKTQRASFDATPIVNRLSGVIKSKKTTRQDYKKHLEKKYLHA